MISLWKDFNLTNNLLGYLPLCLSWAYMFVVIPFGFW